MVIRNLRRCGAARMAAWAMSVAMVAWVPGTGVAFAAGTEMAGMGSALTVASNPIGAAVYVDGKAVGQTPLDLSGLATGDHRVKVVKDGYLENSRVVSVVSGQPSRLDVNLTPHSGRGEARMQVDPGPAYDEGGGGGAKWLLIGAGVVAVGAGVYLLTRDTNEAPTVTGATANPELALAGVTDVRLSVQANDPDGDPLSYSWDFGDGATGTGQSATHRYADPGAYTARVTVSDGEESASTSVVVNVESLSGRWEGTLTGLGVYPIRFNINNNAASIRGTYHIETYRAFDGTVQGNVNADNRVTMTFSAPNVDPFTFTGTVNAGLNVMEGTVNGSGFTAAPMVVRR